jgi:D-xylose 1-dehydrogenase
MKPFAQYPSLQDRPVLITGGASGIGASLVRAFAEQGARVGFVDIAAEAGEALARSLAGSRHAPRFERADLSRIEELESAIARIRDAVGPIQALMNNAANDQRHSIESTSPESWDSGIAVNLRHQFFAAKAVVPDLKAAGGGSIVNFGSVSWKLKQGGMPVYTTSKAAIVGLTRSLARDLGPFNIRVNTLVPGWVMTERQLRLWATEEAKADVLRVQCIPKLLQPEQIAHMALFLAADDSAMCTAQDFVVDAGWS